LCFKVVGDFFVDGLGNFPHGLDFAKGWLMQSVLYKVGGKIFPLFHKLENLPKAKLYKLVVESDGETSETPAYYNPYETTSTDGTTSGQTYDEYIFRVVHSVEPEVITQDNQLITKQREVFIFYKKDLLEAGVDNITMNDLIEFPYYDEPPDGWNYTPQKYRITGIQDLLSLIKVYAEKIST
jgi:hypothetical protein